MWCRDRCDPRWEVMGAGGTLGGSELSSGYGSTLGVTNKGGILVLLTLRGVVSLSGRGLGGHWQVQGGHCPGPACRAEPRLRVCELL